MLEDYTYIPKYKHINVCVCPKNNLPLTIYKDEEKATNLILNVAQSKTLTVT